MSGQVAVSGASQILRKHGEDLSKSLKRQRLIDCRLLDLRKRWKLSLPDHGTKVEAPAQPHEIVAVDVEMYDKVDYQEARPVNIYSLKEPLSTTKNQSSREQATKLVPRYATIELGENVDLVKIDDEVFNANSNDEISKKRRNALAEATIAEPLPMSDSSLRQLDNLLDPSKIEMLTLIVRIEKESTGFSLSVIPPKQGVSTIDDVTITSLQHSLFCASLFDCIRKEILPLVVKTSSAYPSTVATSTAWLPASMDESFLPPPLRMASNGAFSIVHSQEGEVKIRLDSEYSLTFKLMEVGSAAELCEKESRSLSPESRYVKYFFCNIGIFVSSILMPFSL